jgi:dTDP-4-amino-4,6-dideoxygalactose transaminase
MKVPFADLGRLHASIAEELDAAMHDVLSSSQFVGGAHVRDFERAFADAHGADHAVGCGSGTDALALALRGFGVGPGDEVIVPAMTFVATAEAVVHVGATPVLADVDPVSLLLSGDSVAARLTPSTRAVIPVHLFGHVVDSDLMASWRRSGLVVIEDAAQAHLASCTEDPVGSIGHAACFSFYPGKNLGALGDGGAIVSADSGVIDEIARLRDHGRSTKYQHDIVGWCSRLDGLQAAVLKVKLRHLPAWTDARRRIAQRYADHLGEGVLVPWQKGAVHHLLVARVSNRDAVQDRLQRSGIASGVHYPLALSSQPSLARWHTPCAEAERAAAEVLSLPMDPLMDESEVDYVCERLLAAIA